MIPLPLLEGLLHTFLLVEPNYTSLLEALFDQTCFTQWTYTRCTKNFVGVFPLLMCMSYEGSYLCSHSLKRAHSNIREELSTGENDKVSYIMLSL